MYPGNRSNSGPFLVCFHSRKSPGLEKNVNKPEVTQKVLRSSIKFWALSVLFTLFSNPGYGPWAGYISRIYPESTQELDQILGPFWFVYTTESSQDFKKVQTNQTGPRIWKTSWALSGLILVCLHFFSNPGDFLLCKQTRKGPEFYWVPGYFLGKFC